jgi:N utilization substance protein A
VRLASQLTGWDIDILTEAEESERRQKEFAERSNNFMEALDVDEVIAQLLASEGFTSIEEVAYVELQEIASIEGFDEQTAEEIQVRASDFLERRETELDQQRSSLGVVDEMTEIGEMTTAMMVALGENGIKTIEDLADCATDDLIGWNEKQDGSVKHTKGFLEDFDITREDAEKMILEARVKAGWIEPEPEPDEVPETDKQPDDEAIVEE